MSDNTFEGWAIVEMLGHKKLAMQPQSRIADRRVERQDSRRRRTRRVFERESVRASTTDRSCDEGDVVKPVTCCFCREWRRGSQNANTEPVVAIISGYWLCVRHLTIVHAIRDDASQQILPNRVPASRPRRRGAL